MRARQLKLRIELEPARLIPWLEQHDYPGGIPSADDLKDYMVLRVEAGHAEPRAYLWVRWACWGDLEFHACAEGRLWLSKAILERLWLVAEMMGADTLQATPCGPDASKIRRLLHNLGFRRDGADTMRLRLETH